ncbi:hypothetical protein BDB01DRAFT_843846 [Pilobolus umbonatus]|nr:hypothetical protein BDB01DRAFT_843846 [Pilobolus umbonatus]
MKEVGLLESVLSSIRQRMDEEIDELERKIIHYQELISTLFDTEDMKKIPYRLRASFHHDGKSGTGHYWAYIWVEPSEENKLHEVSPDSGWFKFCDALVIPVSEDELFNDPVPPFALMYVDQYLPFFNMNSVQESIPEALKKFVQDDNEALLQEIKNYEQLQESGYGMMLTTPEDSMDYDDKTGDNNQSHYGDIESSSLTFDDNTSTGTVVGQNINEYPQYSFTGNGFFKLKERVDAKMKEVSGYSADDYRFIRKFENFLAISRNKSILEHLYLFYSSEEADKDPIDTDIYVDELASKENEEFSVAWREYNIYLGIAETVTRALFNFSEKKYQAALQLLLKAKQEEAAWKTRIIIDADLFSTYSGLDALSFNNIILVYGKECLEILNQAAFVKACNAAYRTRGLEEAIRIAYQAQSINAPDHIDQNETLRKPWLNFTDQPGVDSLQPVQETLLNTLVMIYIEGQTDASADDTLITEEDTSQFDSLKDMVLWNKYRYICSQCQYMLSSHT